MHRHCLILDLDKIPLHCVLHFSFVNLMFVPTYFCAFVQTLSKLHEHRNLLFAKKCLVNIREAALCSVQCVYKRMMRFQKLTRNLFLALHGHNVHRQQRQLSKFRMRYSSSLFMLTAGPRGHFPRWHRSRKRLSVCSVLRCPDL